MLNTLHINELIDDRYLILKELGRGGMSVVYRALDNKTGETVALKFLNPVNTLPYLELVVKFRNEVKVISTLDHANIINFHATGDYKGTPYLVTELLEGDSLAGLLKKGIKLSINEALILIGEVAEALHCIHSHNIIHRDVKPSNIFIVNSAIEQPEIKLLDFGLAHIMELSNSENNENMSGTFSYMSPEATGIIRKQLDERSDLYSVGVILYYLLAERLPFKSSTTAELLHKIAAMKAAPIHKFNPYIPDVVVRIVNRLLAKDQDERYQSAKGLLHDIQRYLRGEQDFTIGEKDRTGIRLSYQTRLVGREEELTQIKKLINKAARKQGSICLVGGEPGVGKTRLIKAVKEYVYIRGYTEGEIFLESHCMAQENKVPYQVFKHALDEFIQKITRAGAEERAQETKRIQALAGELGAVLLRLNPNLQELLGEVPELPAMDPEKENIRFIITASNFICNLVREDQVCILFLDDLQWADEGSLRLLEHIAGHMKNSNLLILGTYRNNEIDATHGISRIRNNSQFKELGAVTDIEVKPLTHDRVERMVAGLLKEENAQIHDFTEYLINKAGGNPFFTITLLKEIIEHKAIAWEHGVCRVDQEKINSLDLPDNVLDMMLLRTKDISEELEQLLKISAVIGKEFKLYHLYRLIKQNDTSVLELIDQAVQKNLLEYSLSDRSSVRFAHDRIREAFLAKISNQEKSKYHLQVSRFLLEQYKGKEDEILFELTYHLIEGGDKEKGLEYALRAGERAKENYANKDAVTYYIYAKAILDNKEDRTDEYIELLDHLGESYRLIGRFDSSLEILEQCKKLIPDEHKVRKSKILSKMGDAFFEKGEVEKSFHALEQALSFLGIKVPQSTLSVHVSLLVELGIQTLHTWIPSFFTRKTNSRNSDNVIIMLRALNRLYKWYFFKNMKKSLYCHLKSLNLAEKISPCPELVHNYMLGGVVWASIPWESNALRYLNLGVTTAKETGDKLQEGAVYAGYSLAMFMLSKPVVGLEYSKKSIHLLRGVGEYWDLGVAYAFRIQNCLFTGRLNEALAVSEEFIALAGETQALQNLGWGLMGKGKALSLIGEITDLTIIEVQKSFVLMKKTRDMTNMLFSLSTLAYAYLRQKKYFESIQSIEKVSNLFPSHYSNGAWTLDLLPLGAQIYLESVQNISTLSKKKKQEYFKRALWFCKKSLKWSKKFKFIAGWTYQVQGTYNWLFDKKQEAIRNWETGIRFLREQTEDTYRLGYILMEAGSFLIHEQDAGDKKKGKKYLAEARNIFRKIGANTDYKKTLSIAGIKEQPPLEQEPFHEQETTPQLQFSSERKIMTALETSRYLSSILDLDELLEKIMDKTIELLGAEKGILFLYPEDRNQPKKLAVRVARNVECINSENDTFFTSRSIVQKVEKEKVPLIIEDAVTDDIFKEQESVINYGLRSVLCVPIQHRNELLGAVYLDNRMISGLFSKEDLWVLELISSQAGVSIENARLFKQSVMDALTGIYNRAYFDNFLLNSTETTCQKKGKLSLILIDVDKFKIFNDTYGHQVGDIVLQSVAQEIKKGIRKHDVAARYGGDEFAVILPDTGRQEAGLIGEKINRAVYEHKVFHETDCGKETLKITVSVGVAELTGTDRTELIENADQALYRVKELGRNCVVVWDK
ncbi:protein kinase domain-containing protein [Candidatus Electrothrix sp.]|uniref:protein kinase domain-containing protein n=1 Tax=Candidatus Electrothrix sp. TaxID=2170559 RepID=UPI004057B917